jgi:hypothetical protein
MPINGGDARRLTNAEHGVEHLPGGRTQIAYATADDPPNKKEIEKHNDAFEVGDNVKLTLSPQSSTS